MAFAVCAEQFDVANPDWGTALIQKALDQAGLDLNNDFVSNVVLLATPEFADSFEELLHSAVGMTRCMSVWGGCVAGLWVDGKVLGNKPALLVGVFGEAFQAQHDSSTIKISLADTDFDEPCFQVHSTECSEARVRANGMGLLSYGANYSNLPRASHGRITNSRFSHISLQVQNALWLNSEGLHFLSDPMEVTTTNGLFLIEVNGKKAAQALNCPDEQTKPVGLRLQVIHEAGETWVPVMNLLADGTLGLAAPVSKGQTVRLAMRLSEPERQLPNTFRAIANDAFENQEPDLGFIVSGMERSALCHPNEAEFEAVAQAFPKTQLIGILGQAAWLENDEHVVHPPRNNRLALCLFKSKK